VASPKRLTRIIRDLVQGAWRRRFLVLLPILFMVPVSIAAALILPKAYIARSLLQLQESGRDNPFARDGDGASSVYRVQERFQGLRALLISDRVLSQALGAEVDKLPPSEREKRTGELRQALAIDLIGGDFIEVKLSGAQPEGLGKRLETVMASFLEALIPEQGGATAAQLMLSARRQELDALNRAKEEVRRELTALLPNGSDEAAQRLSTIEQVRSGRWNTLVQIEAEISRLREALGKPSDEQLEREMAALPARGSGEADQSAIRDQQSSDRVQALAALKSLLPQRQSLAAQTQNLGTDAATLKGDMSRFQELQERLTGLEKEIAAARQTYDDYQKRFSNTNAVRSVGILRAPELIRIVDPPRDPVNPSGSRVLYVLSGLIAGALLGLGLAFVAERLDQRIRHSDEASEIAGIPVLALARDQSQSTNERLGSGHTGITKPSRLSTAADKIEEEQAALGS